MTTVFDSAIGFKKETTFGTYAAPDKFVEFTAEDLKHNPTFYTGTGRRYGERVPRADRRVLVREEVAGSFTTELLTKGIGALIEAVLGAGTSTQIETTDAYQQLFSPQAGDPVSSYTIQKSVPYVGGATQPHSFLGMVASGFVLTLQNASVPTLQVSWVGKSLSTTPSFASPSYPADSELFSWVSGSIVLGGTLTAPTTDELATVTGGVLADVTDFSLTVDNGLDQGGFYLGSGGQRGRKPLLGALSISGSVTADYTSNALRDAYLNQEDLALVLEFEHPSLIDTGINPVFQVVIPCIRLDGDIPTDAGGAPISLQIPFTGLGKAGVSPLYVAIRTGETGI